MKFLFPKTVVDINTVPDKFRAMYEDSGDGQYALIDDPRINLAIEAVRGAFGALDAERAAHEATRQTVVDISPLAEYGEDVPTIASTLKEKLEKAAKKATKEGTSVEDAVKQAREQWQTEHRTTLEARDKREKGLSGQLEKLLVDRAIRKHVREINPTKAGEEFFEMKMKASVRTKLTDADELAVTVVDDKGAQRYSGSDVNADGSMTLKELAAELGANPDYAAYIQSEAPPGGGTPPGGPTPRPGARRQEQGEKTPHDKIVSGLRKGQHLQGSQTGDRR
jgi:hypothetical protein